MPHPSDIVVEIKITYDPQGKEDNKPYMAIVKFGDQTRGVCGSTPLEALLLATNHWHERTDGKHVPYRPERVPINRAGG